MQTTFKNITSVVGLGVALLSGQPKQAQAAEVAAPRLQSSGIVQSEKSSNPEAASLIARFKSSAGKTETNIATRRAVSVLLLSSGELSEDQVQTLLKDGLADPDKETRTRIAEVLAKNGDAKKAFSNLMGVLTNPKEHNYIRMTTASGAEEAAVRAGPQAVAELLEFYTRTIRTDPNNQMVKQILQERPSRFQLRKIQASEDFVNAVKYAANEHPDSNVRKAAFEAKEHLTKKAAKAESTPTIVTAATK